MSLFLEISFDSDVKARLINPVVKKTINEKVDKPILMFEKGFDKQEKMFLHVRDKDDRPKEIK